ncbi:MAG: glycosyltransferase-like protein [Polyangiaceae bacterium]|jgi:glycosyltransferase involved in cell wall biosynthesis|nr:glycosyltransferase-like protein [Polyangiaceae bacterium]
MSESTALRVLLVDPSLFTAPYDAALTQGLLDAGVEPSWAVRPIRAGDRQELPPERIDPFFYRFIERATFLPNRLRSAFKGLAHAFGLAGLVWRVARRRPDIVHFQWVVVPPLDTLAIWVIRFFAPVVLTVHDSVPYNGQRMSRLQTWGFELPIRLSDRVIVHTRAGREALLARNIPDEKIAIVPHGPLSLPMPPSRPRITRGGQDDRYTFVVFGEIKPYKGCDLIVEALGLLPSLIRKQARVVIAGRPRMDLTPLRERIKALGVGSEVQIRAARLSEEEMVDLFAEADCFLMPYRQIDASGVYFLVKSLGKWLIASRVGIFAEDLQEGTQGFLVPPGSPEQLAVCMARAVVERPRPEKVEAGAAWTAIGQTTSQLYRELLNPAPVTAEVLRGEEAS